MSIGEFARRSRLSPKALRFYDGLGLLSPARVDEQSGYRYYQPVQLERGRLIATLRQIGVPLATVKDLVELDPAELAERVMAHRNEAATQHAVRQELVTALVDRLTGRSTVMYEVASREMPARSLLCLKRNVDETGAWKLGKEFIGIIRDPRLPRMPGREGAMFSIYWGQVSADSDGPMEMCNRFPTPRPTRSPSSPFGWSPPTAKRMSTSARPGLVGSTLRALRWRSRRCGPGPRGRASTMSSSR